MSCSIETEREVDGRWIAEIPTLPGVVAYDKTRLEAIANMAAIPLRVLARSTSRKSTSRSTPSQWNSPHAHEPMARYKSHNSPQGTSQNSVMPSRGNQVPRISNSSIHGAASTLGRFRTLRKSDPTCLNASPGTPASRPRTFDPNSGVLSFEITCAMG